MPVKLTETEARAMQAERRHGVAKPKPLSEAQIQRQILDMLKVNMHVGHAWRVNTQGVPLHGKGQAGKFRPAPCKGVSDILAVLTPTGQMMAIEVKSKKGRATDEQRAFIESIKKSGGIALIARSVEEVEMAIDGASRRQVGVIKNGE